MSFWGICVWEQHSRGGGRGGDGEGFGQPTPTPPSAFSHFCLGDAQGEGGGKPAFVQHQALKLSLDFEVITGKEERIKHVYTVL